MKIEINENVENVLCWSVCCICIVFCFIGATGCERDVETAKAKTRQTAFENGYEEKVQTDNQFNRRIILVKSAK